MVSPDNYEQYELPVDVQDPKTEGGIAAAAAAGELDLGPALYEELPLSTEEEK